MFEDIDKINHEVEKFQSNSPEELEQFRIAYLGKKGKVTLLFSAFKEVPVDQKKEFGKQLNILKNNCQEKIKSLKSKLSSISDIRKSNTDYTIPGQPMNFGSRHPITLIRDRVINIFSQIGFSISEGPEIEDDWHNFTALNFPKEHPARDMQDTFFIQEDIALRTHTSSVQVRVMENNQPPIRTISPGRVYRNEAISARAHCFFHQIEGLYIDKDVSFSAGPDIHLPAIIPAHPCGGRATLNGFIFAPGVASVSLHLSLINSKIDIDRLLSSSFPFPLLAFAFSMKMNPNHLLDESQLLE